MDDDDKPKPALDDDPEVSFLRSTPTRNTSLASLPIAFATVCGIASTDLAGDYRAVEDLIRFVKLVRLATEDVPLRQLFSGAIDEIRGAPTDYGSAPGFYDAQVLTAAMRGMQFIVERSCHDNAAKARAPRREQEFIDLLRRIDEARGKMAKEIRLRTK